MTYLLTVALFSLPYLSLQSAGIPAPAAVSVSAKIILYAGLVSSFLQMVKRAVPGLHGSAAIAVNVVAALAASLSIASPTDFHTFNFYIALGTQILATAGIHDLASFLGLFKTASK